MKGGRRLRVRVRRWVSKAKPVSSPHVSDERGTGTQAKPTLPYLT